MSLARLDDESANSYDLNILLPSSVAEWIGHSSESQPPTPRNALSYFSAFHFSFSFQLFIFLFHPFPVPHFADLHSSIHLSGFVATPQPLSKVS